LDGGNLTVEFWEIETLNNSNNSASGEITIVPTHDFLGDTNKFRLGKIRYATIRAEDGAFVPGTYSFTQNNMRDGENWGSPKVTFAGYSDVVGQDPTPDAWGRRAMEVTQFTRNAGGQGAYAIIYRVGNTIGWVEVITVTGSNAPVPPKAMTKEAVLAAHQSFAAIEFALDDLVDLHFDGDLDWPVINEDQIYDILKADLEDAVEDYLVSNGYYVLAQLAGFDVDFEFVSFVLDPNPAPDFWPDGGKINLTIKWTVEDIADNTTVDGNVTIVITVTEHVAPEEE
jgi:hypothetical protein